jgi:cobalamin biosynthetic protein CobC
VSAAWTWHGGGLEAAKRHFGDGSGGGDWLDLSTGINPHPWPGVADVRIDWQRLPEREASADLEAAAAAHFGCDPRHVCAVPGTEIALRLVGQHIGGAARHRTPTYRTHAEMIPGAQAADLDESTRGTLIVANPNNPDGHVLAPDRLLALLDSRTADEWLLLDEAFADAHPALSLARHIADTRRLVIFRSFGKFFGLAGLRLGFVLGPPTILAPIRSLLGAWPVSAAAIAIGTRAYCDTPWIPAMRVQLETEAAALDTVLSAPGYRPIGACPLFRLIQTPDAAALFERLGRRQILTRPFADRPDWLRIGLPPSAQALDRLALALQGG